MENLIQGPEGPVPPVLPKMKLTAEIYQIVDNPGQFYIKPTVTIPPVDLTIVLCQLAAALLITHVQPKEQKLVVVPELMGIGPPPKGKGP